MDPVDRIEIDDDDGRFVLVLDGERLDIHHCAIELYEQVVKEIGPYAREAQQARATMPPSYEPGEAYSADDPKHPDYHDMMSDLWDSRRGK